MWTFNFYMINCENLEKTSLGIAIPQSHPQFRSTAVVTCCAPLPPPIYNGLHRSTDHPLLISLPSVSSPFIALSEPPTPAGISWEPTIGWGVGRLASDLHLSFLSPKHNPRVSAPALQRPLATYPLPQSITLIFPPSFPSPICCFNPPHLQQALPGNQQAASAS